MNAKLECFGNILYDMDYIFIARGSTLEKYYKLLILIYLKMIGYPTGCFPCKQMEYISITLCGELDASLCSENYLPLNNNAPNIYGDEHHQKST